MSTIIAAVDIETTGFNPTTQDIIELAIQPLNADFTIMDEIPPFVARIKARRPWNASPKALEVNGLDMNEGDDYEEMLARLKAWRRNTASRGLTFSVRMWILTEPSSKPPFPNWGRCSGIVTSVIPSGWPAPSTTSAS